MIDFIYFDLGKVILEFDHQVLCQNTAELAGISDERAKEILFESGLEEKYETGLLTCEEFHQQFCEVAGAHCGQEELMFAISDMFRPNQAMFPLIAQLRANGFPIGILSNTCKAHWDFVTARYTILQDFFSPHILSFEAKSMKPDGGIYRQALEKSKSFGDRIFFVDDKPENVQGAIDCGIDAVLYTSVNQLYSDLVDRGVLLNL